MGLGSSKLNIKSKDATINKHEIEKFIFESTKILNEKNNYTYANLYGDNTFKIKITN